MNKVLLAGTIVVAIIAGSTAGAQAPNPQAPNLADKTVTLIIASGPGAGFDLWGRAIARHLGKHLPGQPNVVPQNMPGAGGFVAANHLYHVAPRDGTAMAIVPGSTPLGPLLGAGAARFDATKFTAVGSPAIETPVCFSVAGPHVKVRTVQELYEKELVVGSTGQGAGTHTWPKALAALLGMKFKVIAGFQSTASVFLAMERGEVDGLCTILDTIPGQRPDWIPNRKIALLFHAGGSPSPLLNGVPYIGDLAKTPDERAVIEFLFAGASLGRPIIAPPGLTAERATMLQDAFMATMKDPDFLADAKRQNLEVEPQNGGYLGALITKIHATPKPIVDKVAELIR